MGRTAQQADRFTAFGVCPRVPPIRDFGELITYARRIRRKATAGTVAFSFWGEDQLPDFVIAQHLNKIANPSVGRVGDNTRNLFS
jgi:hypothetical protein